MLEAYMINTVLAEADEICYRAAASCQHVCHVVKFKTGEVKDLGNEFTITNLRKFYKDQGLHEGLDYTVELYDTYAPENELIQNLNSMITMLWKLGDREDAVKFNIGQIEQVEFWLSPTNRESNFRFSVVRTAGPKGLGYKQGRGPKPHYLARAKEYLLDIHGAKEIEGFEADDAIAMRQTQHTILSSIDKDLNMIPGLHYNNYYDEVYFVPQGLGGTRLLGTRVKTYGLLAFYQQLLTGDAIDNIPGCLNPDKLHHKKPPNFSPEYATEQLELLNDNERDYFEYVVEMYKLTYKENWKEVLFEIADLIWICRTKHETGRQYIQNKGWL